MKKVTSMLLALAMCLSLCVPAFANEDEVLVELPFGGWNRSTVPSGCEVSGSMGDRGNSTWYRSYAFATYEITYTTLLGAQSSSVVIKVDKNGNVS